MASLAQLKKKKGSNLKSLQEKLESSSKGSGPRDERIWKPKFNADKGKGSCTVRFLPAKDGDPFVEVKNYSFNGPGGNFYDLALQSIGQDDPVQIAAINMFRKAKSTDDKQLREKTKKLLPKSRFYANVYIVKDEEVPENEGKVFIWQFGPAIYKKIKAAIQPEFDDQEPMDPFDLWDGADFKIRMVGTTIPDSKTGKNVTVPNYDNSEFARQSEFMDGDEEKLDEIFQQTYDLSDFNDPSKFKDFDSVAERFEKVTGKHYRHYDPDFVGEHLKAKEEKDQLDQQQDNDSGVDKFRDSPKEPDFGGDEPPFEPDQPSTGSTPSGDDDEDPVARFKRMAQGK